MEQKMEKLSYNKIGGTNSLTGDRLNELFNISEIGLDLIFIIKLYL
jgi:hypothetical protein